MTFDEYVEDEKEKAKKLGIKEGLAKGKAEGIAEYKLTIAKEMLSNGLSIDLIQKCTSLTKEDIQKLNQ